MLYYKYKIQTNILLKSLIKNSDETFFEIPEKKIELFIKYFNL